MYQYFDLDDSGFENLAIAICKQILGQATQAFAKGADGGKDGEFRGTANEFPSKSSPWIGTTIIQAKHTKGINKHFIDSDFFGNKSCILAKEVIKVKNMVEQGLIDHYMLFANRSLTGGFKPKIIQYIADNTGLACDDIAIFGDDDLDYYLSCYPSIANMKNINLEPLSHAPAINLNDLSEVIGQLAQIFDNKNTNQEVSQVFRTTFKQKNQLNNLSDDTAKSLERNYLKYVWQIKDFLNDPQNQVLQDHYQNAVEEFQLQYIIPKQRELQYFDEVFNELVKYLTTRDYILKSNTRLVRMMVFYMYWNCDIGKSNDTP